VKEDSVAIDIGAHIGIHTITMSRKVGPNGKVFAFEPQKKMYRELLKNLEINGCNNVTAIRKALGETAQVVQLNHRNIYNEGGTAIGQGGDDAEVITLDSLNLCNVSLIKMDVECYERYVFEGARETILKNHPIIIFELMAGEDYLTCSPDRKMVFEQFFSYVESMGYEVKLIFGADYIAIPKE
jgi:FkbM family methyltransferase